MLNYLSERPRNVLLCCAWGWWGSTSALKKSLGGPKFAQKDSTSASKNEADSTFLLCKFRWENRWLSLSCGCPTFKSWNAIELASASAPSSIWRGLLALLRRASSPVCFYLQKISWFLRSMYIRILLSLCIVVRCCFLFYSGKNKFS